MMHGTYHYKAVSWFLLLVSPACSNSHPNIVIHLADDLGIGDVGCYGNTTLNTPNLDQLAREGIKLTHHLAAASLCTPSRAAFLTGRYPVRYGLAGGFVPLIANAANIGGLLPAEITFAELAKEAGYKTALIGKWHLGLYNVFRKPVFHPLNQGFDYFYGLPYSLMSEFGEDGRSTILRAFPNCNRNNLTFWIISLLSFLFLKKKRVISTKTFVIAQAVVSILCLYLFLMFMTPTLISSVLMRDYTTIERPIRLKGLTQRFVVEGREFLQKAATSDQPFLLFMSWGHTHTYLAPSRKFAGRTRHGRYGDCVEELDWGIGEINSVLDDLNLTDNTFVYFTSDHGADIQERGSRGEVDGGSNGIYKGSKGQGTVDGAFRTPGVMRFPGGIRPDTVSDLATSHLDILPLMAHLTGTTPPRDRHIDGRNIIDILEGKPGTRSPHEFLFHYCETQLSAVRYMPKEEEKTWKVAYWYPDLYRGGRTCKADDICLCSTNAKLDPPLLFDLTSDPAEERPIQKGDNPDYARIVAAVDDAVSKHETTIEEAENQLTFVKSMWLPHLLTCCGFPSCSCTEPRYTDKDLE